MRFVRSYAIALWFSALNIVLRIYWNSAFKRQPNVVIARFMAGFREYLTKTPSQSMHRGSDLSRSKGFTLAPVTIGGYLRVAKKFVKDERTIYPTKRQMERRVASLREKGASYTHVTNTASCLEWVARYRSMRVKLGRPRKPDRRVREVLTEREIKALFEACRSPREKALMALSAWSGIRTTELTKVRVKDLDLTNLCVTIVCGKYFRDRTVCLTQEAADYLAQYIKVKGKGPEEFLFGRSTGSLRRTMHRIRKRTVVTTPSTPQRLRRSLATNLHLRGADIATIKSQMGHKDEKTTLDSYIKVGPEMHRQKYDRYVPIYQDSQMDRHIEKFVTGEFTFGGDPLNIEASHYKPEMAHLLTVQDQLRAYAESLRQRVEAQAKQLFLAKEQPGAVTNAVISAGASAGDLKVEASRKGATRPTKPVKAPKESNSEVSTRKAKPRSKRVKPAPKGRPRKSPALTQRQKSVLRSLKGGAIPLTNAVYQKAAEVTRNIASYDIMNLCKLGVLQRDPHRGGRSSCYWLTDIGLAAV